MFQIIAANVSKEFRIYHRPVDRLLESILRRPRHRSFSAVNTVSFSLRRGESLGIIGDNGAGKSTLLKMIAGTLMPSSGHIAIQGRVAALLELGAGFHPEFTGRQNIYLNASLMGISAKDIAAREHDIIAFSELEGFIDRPVKTYSSGMYIRLAFAIATSVDPDILVIDEALAVGDVSFQLKCIERMGAFRERGTTMIFCSHSMYHVRELCNKVMWLEKGKVKQMGEPVEVTSRYESSSLAKNRIDPEEREEERVRTAPKDCVIKHLGMKKTDGTPLKVLSPLMDVVLEMKVKVVRDGIKPNFGFAFVAPDETILSAAMTHHDRINCGPFRTGEEVRVSLVIERIPIREGTYRLAGGVAEETGLLWYETKDLWPVRVEGGQGIGPVTFQHKWDVTGYDQKKHGKRG